MSRYFSETHMYRTLHLLFISEIAHTFPLGYSMGTTAFIWLVVCVCMYSKYIHTILT